MRFFSAFIFTGGSFRNMTEMAGADEKVWFLLYLASNVNKLQKIGTLINSLQRLKAVMDSVDNERL